MIIAPRRQQKSPPTVYATPIFRHTLFNTVHAAPTPPLARYATPTGATPPACLPWRLSRFLFREPGLPLGQNHNRHHYRERQLTRENERMLRDISPA